MLALFFPPKYNGTERLDDKVAVITGCNTGIGKFNALDFSRRGCRVIMACRNLEKAEEARKDILEQLKDQKNTGELVIKQLDLSSLKSVRKCADEILDTEKQIHLLINNAGVMMCPKELTQDGYEKQFATNHLGHFLFTLLLLPRIMSSAPARILNISSEAHRVWADPNFDDLNYESHRYTPTKAYGRSKLANVLFTKELAKRLQGSNVNVYALHPGIVDTELTRHLDDSYFKGGRRLAHFALGAVWRTSEQGAQTALYCALSEETGKQTGEYYSDCKRKTPSSKARNADLAKKLWEISARCVELGDYDPFSAKEVMSHL